MNKNILITAVALTSMLTACGSDADDPTPQRTTSIASSKTTTATPAPTGPEMHALDDTIYIRDDIILDLGKITRGRTGKIGVPEDTSYIRVGVTLTNNTKTPLDLGTLKFSCPTQEVYDGSKGMEGVPDVHVLPGRSLAWPLACAQDKNETHVQLELQPQRGEDRIVIFTGTIE